MDRRPRPHGRSVFLLLLVAIVTGSRQAVGGEIQSLLKRDFLTSIDPANVQQTRARWFPLPPFGSSPKSVMGSEPLETKGIH